MREASQTPEYNEPDLIQSLLWLQGGKYRASQDISVLLFLGKYSQEKKEGFFLTLPD